MKRVIALMAAVTFCVLLTLNFVKAQDNKGFTFTAAKCAKAAVINGAADEGEYPSSSLSMKQTPERGTITGEAAKARVFHDCKTLYVSITVPFKDAKAVSKGEGWGQDDGAEVCFRDASSTQAGQTFVIHGFASGKHECTTDGGAASDAVEKLGKGVKFSAKIDKQSWTGEWAISLEAAGLKYKPGMCLGFNLGAWRAEGGEWIVWRGAEGATYQLENGGKLTLE